MKTIPLIDEDERVALVDDSDYEWLSQYEWYYSRRGVCIRGTFATMSHIILQVDGQIDHKDGEDWNNQRFNLRPCTNTQNSQNRKKGKKASSEYKGVCFNRNKKKWQAGIGLWNLLSGKYSKYLGLFLIEEDAAKAYDEAARHYFGEFAALNFPREDERSCL
jgi:hypothetical protein